MVWSGNHLLMDCTDAEVMAASLEDPAAFALLFDRHVVAVHRVLARRLGGPGADDLTGEVFRIAFEARGSYDGAYVSARPWLFGIALNVIRRESRTERRRLRVLARGAAQAELSVDPLLSVDERVDAGVEARVVLDALADLSPGDRDVLLLVAWEQLEPSEVAAVLGIPAGTVRSRLHRARRLLREHVESAPVDAGQEGST